MPSSDRDHRIYASDIHGKCTNNHGGTSAAAPMAAGAFALILGVNPDLTWRDLQWVVVNSSSSHVFDHRDEWQVNGAGFAYSHSFGFGALNIADALDLARGWINVPEFKIQTQGARASATSILVDPETSDVTTTEQVMLVLSLSPSRGKTRGDISVTLISPQGTRAYLATRRVYDFHVGTITNWPFSATCFWGEDPRGTWTLEISNAIVLDDWDLNIYGF